jgi:N-methylhydantoinase B
VRLGIVQQLLASIAEEMGAALMRSAYSPNIKERRDFSCALFDGGGRMLVQGDNIPVHLGSMPESVSAAVAAAPLEEGDVVVLNDPYRGGTHLPDITMVAPVFLRRGRRTRRRPDFLVANRAHHSDVGGMSPGSMPLAREIFQEGLILPPVRLVRRGVEVKEVATLVLANVRTPDERRGDLLAQVAANAVGERRLREIWARLGPSRAGAFAEALLTYSERFTREAIREIPDGAYRHQETLEPPPGGRPPAIRVTLRVRGESAVVDFTGTDPQLTEPLNAVPSIVRSAVHYVFRCLVPEDVPFNAGCMRPVRVVIPEGCLLNARPPAPVAGGNVETSQRVVDVLLGALARALPERIPAASQGTMNNLALGGIDPLTGAPFSYYETIAGGVGGGPSGPGPSGTHSHMTNSLNTPIEALERSLPLRVTSYTVRRASGGAGRNDGGDGVVREIEALARARATLLTERRSSGPPGARGGSPGTPGRNRLRRAGARREVALTARAEVDLGPGDRLRVDTPGGGGWGGWLRRAKAPSGRAARRLAPPCYKTRREETGA